MREKGKEWIFIDISHHASIHPFIHSQACLEHRHSYVRKNAALTVLNIHHNVSADLLPDAPDLINKFIQVSKQSCILYI